MTASGGLEREEGAGGDDTDGWEDRDDDELVFPVKTLGTDVAVESKGDGEWTAA